MFQINLSIDRINYESILHTVFPTVLERVKEKDSNNLLFRLVRELDEDGEKVLQALMTHLPEDIKNELVCQCLNSYVGTLTRKLNEYLQADTWGRNFAIGSEGTDKGAPAEKAAFCLERHQSDRNGARRTDISF